MIDIVWIKRISSEEDKWLKQNLLCLDRRFGVIVVGHTDLDSNYYNFKYIPYYENGIDSMGLICHKKNLGVQASNKKYCLVLHSDITPNDDFYDLAINKNIDIQTVIAPVAFCGQNRALTWCTYAAKHKDVNELADENTYISGGAIFSLRETFLKFPWNENLRHNMEEDVELSRRMFQNNVKLMCMSDLVLEARRNQ